MRKLLEVIDEMLELVPHAEEDLRVALKSRRGSVTNAPPEAMSFQWQTVAETLANHFPAKLGDFKPWQRQVAEVWSKRKFAKMEKLEKHLDRINQAKLTEGAATRRAALRLKIRGQ